MSRPSLAYGNTDTKYGALAFTVNRAETSNLTGWHFGLRRIDGIVVSGRIDLIRHTDNDQTAVVDFKRQDRVQAEDLTRMQLHICAAGYRQLTGTNADLIQVHSLDDG